MARPLRDDDLTRVAAFLAEEEERKKGAQAPQPRRIFRNMPQGLETAEVSEGNVVIGRRGDADRQALQQEGYEWLPGEEYAATVAYPSKPVKPPPGKLPFISGTPTHEAPEGYSSARPSRWDPGMAGAMSTAAAASRQISGDAQALLPADGTAYARQRTPTPAATTAGMKRSLGLEVRSTKSGVQPELRPHQELARLAPADAERRLEGLPESVAAVMKKRWGLREAQEDANRRALGVELASALGQVAHGIAGSRYDNSRWDGQRTAARQPVADYQARTQEEREDSEEARRAAQDERAAREAAHAAQLELEKFRYGKTRDTAEDQLQRDRMAQEREIAEARLRGDAADRGLRREEMRFRLKEGQEIKERLAREKEEERQRREGERDLQRLGEATAKAPFGEFQRALEDINRVAPGMAYGEVPAKSPISGVDRLAQAVLPRGAADWVMSEEGKQYTTAAANLRDLISRMRSGAVLNTGEERHYLNLLSDDKLSDPRTAALGINAVRQGIAQKLRNAQGAYEPTGTLDRYEATGATTYRAPIFAGPEKKQYSRSRNQTRVLDGSGRVIRVEQGDTRGR